MFPEASERTLTVEVRDNADEARYEIREDGQLAGFAEYRLSKGRMTLTHTEIETARAGRGLAGQLARAALEDAKTRGLKVVPRCAFMAGFVRRHADEYLPLIVPSLRKRLMETDGRE